MSTKNNKKTPPLKPLRSALKESHKDNAKQASFKIDPNKCNKLKNILKNKLQSNHRHKKQKQKQKNIIPPIINTNDDNKEDEHKTWSCSMCTYANISIMSYCELCSTPKPQNNQNKENMDCDQTHHQNQVLEDARLAEKLMLEEDQDCIHFTVTSCTLKQNHQDEQYAKKLQRELKDQDAVIKQKCQESDELTAIRLQMDHEREMIELERQRMENERAAIALQAMEQRENAKYLEFKKEQEQTMKLDQEFAMKLQKEQQLQMDEQKVTDLFQKSLKRSRCIVSIEDISGNDKNEIYEKILSEKVKNSGKSRHEIERYLFHGTKNLDNLNLILKNGFDRSYNTTAAFGKGTYFAKDSSYSVKGYCGCDNNGVFYILLCKVIVGEYTVGNSRVSAITKKPDGTEYDSLVNDMRRPSIFVIWRDYHACPAYLIKFK